METIIMPRLGFTMLTGVIEKWHKKEGDKVEKGDILFEVVTDKVTVEVESLYSGYLRKIIGLEGKEIPVNEVIGYIGGKDEEVPKEAEKVDKGVEVKKPVEEKVAAGAVQKVKKRIIISPLARKTAKELGIDYELEPIKGTDPGGRISKDDILTYAKMKKEEAKIPLGLEGREIKIKSASPIKGMRKAIAERMSYSKKNIPHLILNTKADVTSLIKLRERLKDEILSTQGLKITYTDLLLKTCAIALKENIEINSSLLDEEYIVYEDVNVGFAVSVKDGLLAPTIYECDKLDIPGIARKRIELVEKAREGKLSLREITNGTFTITNLGMFGVRSFSAIINPPQAAILAVGEIYLDTAVIDGKIEIRSFMELSLSCDHRIADGTLGARFLQRIVELIENPEKLLT